jgi:hypothetical protein
MPDQREIDRAAVISAMSRAKQNEAAQATIIVQKALSLTKPVNLHSSSLLRKTSSNMINNNIIASSCPSNLTIIEKQPDVVLDTTTSNNTLPTEETNTS